jgi:hypothetical protein
VTASLSPDGKPIKKAISALHGANGVIELRAIHKGGRKRVDAGFFDGEHRDEQEQSIRRLALSGMGVT